MGEVRAGPEPGGDGVDAQACRQAGVQARARPDDALSVGLHLGVAHVCPHGRGRAVAADDDVVADLVGTGNQRCAIRNLRDAGAGQAGSDHDAVAVASGRQGFEQGLARGDDFRCSVPGFHERAERSVCQHEPAAPTSVHIGVWLAGAGQEFAQVQRAQHAGAVG